MVQTVLVHMLHKPYASIDKNHLNTDTKITTPRENMNYLVVTITFLITFFLLIFDAMFNIYIEL